MKTAALDPKSSGGLQNQRGSAQPAEDRITSGGVHNQRRTAEPALVCFGGKSPQRGCAEPAGVCGESMFARVVRVRVRL